MSHIAPGGRASEACAKWASAMSAAIEKFSDGTNTISVDQWRDKAVSHGSAIDWEIDDWDDYADTWHCTYCRSITGGNRCHECGAPHRA